MFRHCKCCSAQSIIDQNHGHVINYSIKNMETRKYSLNLNFVLQSVMDLHKFRYFWQGVVQIDYDPVHRETDMS